MNGFQCTDFLFHLLSECGNNRFRLLPPVNGSSHRCEGCRWSPGNVSVQISLESSHFWMTHSWRNYLDLRQFQFCRSGVFLRVYTLLYLNIFFSGSKNLGTRNGRGRSLRRPFFKMGPLGTGLEWGCDITKSSFWGFSSPVIKREDED